MMTTDPTRVTLWPALAVTAALLIAGHVDWPTGPARAAIQAIRSAEPPAGDREGEPGGYYEGLINRGATDDRTVDEVALRLLGKPERWISFHDMGATHYIDDSFIQFILRPDVRTPVFDHVFTTNALGLRDRDGYTVAKPPGVFRIVLLGSSIDMGWGVSADATYEHWLETWLNARAAKLGIERRFEVINFAMAAYGPTQRLERYRTFARHFEPDLVLYSATMLDTRLAQIHITDILRHQVEPPYSFVNETLAAAGIDDSIAAVTADGSLRDKNAVKSRLRPYLWSLCDSTVGALAADCRSTGTPLACLIIPRAGLSDLPEARAAAVARHAAIARRHSVPLLDLTGAFDEDDPTALALAPWDDHPNAEGHKLIFYALADALVADDGLSTLLFGAPGGGRVLASLERTEHETFQSR